MITSTQCKMARVALGWTARDLADRAKIGVATVNRFEAGVGKPITLTLEAMQWALENAGVRFTADGCVCPPPEDKGRST